VAAVLVTIGDPIRAAWFADTDGTVAWAIVAAVPLASGCLGAFAIWSIRNSDKQGRRVVALETDVAKKDARLAVQEERSSELERGQAEMRYERWLDGDIGQLHMWTASWGHGPTPTFDWYLENIERLEPLAQVLSEAASPSL
jgi:hypothetical protein